MKRLLLTIGLLLYLLCSVEQGYAQTPPTFISYNENTTGFANTTSPVSTAVISWQTNDVIVVLAGSEGLNSSDLPAVPTATGLTFSSVVVTGTPGTFCGARISTATAASNGSSVVTGTDGGGTSHWGFGVWVIRGSTGVGASVVQTTSGLTKAMISTQANSYIIWGVFDFAAASLQTITPTPTDTRERAVQSGAYTYYVADLASQSSTSPINYGISGSGSGPFSIVGIEVKGTAGAASTCVSKVSLLGVGCS